MACQIPYIRSQQLPEVEKARLEDIHVQLFKDAKKSGAFRTFQNRLYSRKNSYERAIAFVAKSNTELGAKVVTLQTSQPGQHFLSVNVLPLAEEQQGVISYKQKVDYQLKVFNALKVNYDKIEKLFNQIGNTDTFWNKLQQDFQIPKDQVQLLRSQEGDTPLTKWMNLAANYSYTVEVNTAKEDNTVVIKGNLEYTEDRLKSIDKEYEVTSAEYIDRMHGREPRAEYKDKFTVVSVDYDVARGQRFGIRSLDDQVFNTKEAAEAYRKLIIKDKIDELREEIEQYKKNLKESKDYPTQYYSNLTVPGGTNYTENEIKTPAITPSIKGHAQFSTDQGIGWFRSDEAVVGGKFVELVDKSNSVRYAAYLMGDDSVIDKTTQGGTPTKTRRILEVQSDLFQKGRDKFNLVGKPQSSMDTQQYELPHNFVVGDIVIAPDQEEYKVVDYFPGSHSFFMSDENQQEPPHPESLTVEDSKGEQHTYYDEDISNLFLRTNKSPSVKQNQFLQLLNKDNNWVAFFIKSIIQDSAKKGYEKVLFPSGDTASKVEGHETLEQFKATKEKRLKELQHDLSTRKQRVEDAKTGKIIKDEKEGKGFYYFHYGKERMLAGSTSDGEAYYRKLIPDTEKRYIEQDETEISQLKRELEMAETDFGSLRKIWKFYENTVHNILKKNWVVTDITDEYGNKWYQIDLTPYSSEEKALEPILLYRSPSIPDVSAVTDPVQDKIKALTAAFDKIGVHVTVNINDNIDANAEVNFLGKNKAEINLRSIVFNDTLEHEFAHVYVELISPFLQDQLWKEIQSSRTDVIKYVEANYPEIDRGSDQFKKECMAWVVGEEAAKTTPKKLSKLQITLQRIFRWIGSLFGKSPEWGKQLAQEMISGTLVVRNKAELPTGLKQEQRRGKNITPKEFAENTLVGLEAKIREISKTGVRKGGEGTLQVFNNLMEALQKANDVERLRLINRHIQDQVGKMRGIAVTPRGLDAGFLRNASDFVDLYAGIEDIEVPFSERTYLSENKLPEDGAYDPKVVSTKLNDEVNALRANSLAIEDLRRLLLNRTKEYILKVFTSVASNEAYKNDMEKVLESERDLSYLSRWMSPLYESPLPLFQLTDKYLKEQLNGAKFDAEKYLEELQDLYTGIKAIGWDWLHEKDSKGENTGRWIQEESPEYRAIVQDFNDKITAYRASKLPENQKIADELEEQRREFFRKNTYQPYNEKYQEIYAILDRVPEARKMRDKINDAMNDIKNKANVVGDEFDPAALSPEDYEQLIHLMDAKDALSSLVDTETGLPKTGKERLIAETVREFNQKIGDVYESSLSKRRKDAFDQAKEVAKARGEDYYQKWLLVNSRREISPAYFNQLEKAFALLEGSEKSEISAINDQIRELAGDYKMKGGFFRAKMLSERNPELFKKIQALERKKEAILKEKSNNTSKYVRPFEIPEELQLTPNSAFFDKIEEAKKALTPTAKKWKDDFKAQIYSVLVKYVKDGSRIYNSYDLSPEDLATLIELQRTYNAAIGYGLKKEQLTPDQQSIRAYNEILSKLSDFTDNKELRDKFAADEEIAKSRGDDYYNLWKEWFEKEKTIYNEFNEAVSALIGYQTSVPLKDYVDWKKTEAYRQLNKLSVRINSPEYEKALQEAKTWQISQFNEWYKNNHYYDPIAGKQVPFLIWTQNVPKDPKYIDNEAPSYFWHESKVKDEYLNPEYESHRDPKTGFGKPLPKWTSKQWKAIQALSDVDPKKKFYNWFSQMMKDITSEMGNSILDRGYYPTDYEGDKKGLKENLHDLPSVVWRSRFSEFEKYETLPGFRLAMPFTQILQHEYPTKDKDGNITDTPEEHLRKIKSNREFHRKHINYNVHNMLQDFIPAILRYKAKNNILDELILVEKLFLHEADIKNSKGLKQSMSRKTMKALGREESSVVQVEPEESRLYERFKDWMSMVFYDEGLVPWHSRPNDKGYVIDYNKIVRSLNRYTQLKALAFNVYAGVSNVTMGQVQLKMEAASKLFFGNRNLRAGHKLWAKELPQLTMDNFSTDKKSLSGKIMKLFGFESGEGVKDRFGGFNKEGLVANSLMLISRQGDAMLQAVQTFAQLDANTIENGKVVRIKDPKTQKSILKMMQELNEKNPNIRATQLLKEVGLTTKQYSVLKGQIQFVFNRLNGIYNAEDKMAAQKYAAMSMAVMFRKWIVPGFERRFERKRYIEQAETDVMGYYVATWDFLKKIGSDIAKLRTGLIRQKWDELPEYQKAGIRATLSETAILLSTIILVLLLTSGGDDDEPESKWHAFMRYQLERLRADILFYNPLGGGVITGDMLKILRSPVVTMSTIDDATEALAATFAYPFQDSEHRVYQTGSNKGKLKVIKQWEDMVPLMNQINRLGNPAQQADYYRLWNF